MSCVAPWNVVEQFFVWCNMSDLQRSISRSIVTSAEAGQVLAAEEMCSCSSGRKNKHCCKKVDEILFQ